MSDLERWVAQLLRTRNLVATATDAQTRNDLMRLASDQAAVIRKLVGRKETTNA